MWRLRRCLLTQLYSTMNTSLLGLAGYTLLAPGLTAPSLAPSVGLYISQFDAVLGTSLTLKAVARSLAAAQQAEQAALAEIDRLKASLNSYDSTSEFSRWLTTQGEATPISADLFAVLAHFDHWSAQTQGVLNAGTELLSQLWQQAAHRQGLPDAAALEHAQRAVSQPHWQLNVTDQTATRLTATPLRLHSFAKNYVLQRAAEAALAVTGVDGIVLNGGGDLVVRGHWTEPVGIARPDAAADNAAPLTQLAVRDRAVATSGTYRRGIRIGDQWFSHLIDPRTGQPAQAIASATVVHPDAVTAGALATAFTLLSPADSRQLASRLPGTDYLLITAAGEQHTSAGWNELTRETASAEPVMVESTGAESTVARLTSLATAKDKYWNPNQELLINFRLPQFEGRSHRPFVSVWIEDEKGVPVRNLALWYNKPRWLPELSDWYASQRQSDFDARSISSATRSAGDYALQWDGKDNAGQLVKQGKYTICLEAAREHGTHQLIRQVMDFNGKTKQLTVPGNVEIATAALDYRQKPGVR